MNAELGRGKSDILRVASIWADLRMRQNSEPRNQATTVPAAPAVTGITVLGDGIGEAKGKLTGETRPFRSLRGF